MSLKVIEMFKNLVAIVQIDTYLSNMYVLRSLLTLPLDQLRWTDI